MLSGFDRYADGQGDRTFASLSIPSAGRFGWCYNTDPRSSHSTPLANIAADPTANRTFARRKRADGANPPGRCRPPGGAWRTHTSTQADTPARATNSTPKPISSPFTVAPS